MIRFAAGLVAVVIVLAFQNLIAAWFFIGKLGIMTMLVLRRNCD